MPKQIPVWQGEEIKLPSPPVVVKKLDITDVCRGIQYSSGVILRYAWVVEELLAIDIYLPDGLAIMMTKGQVERMDTGYLPFVKIAGDLGLSIEELSKVILKHAPEREW